MSNIENIAALTQRFAPLIGRILIASIFVMAGVDKISGYEGTAGWMESFGVPGALLPLVIALEIVGGLAIIVGYRTRLVAFAMAGFTLVAAIIFHYSPADQMQMLMFYKNISITGGFLFLVAFGAGTYSIDNHRA